MSFFNSLLKGASTLGKQVAAPKGKIFSLDFEDMLKLAEILSSKIDGIYPDVTAEVHSQGVIYPEVRIRFEKSPYGKIVIEEFKAIIDISVLGNRPDRKTLRYSSDDINRISKEIVDILKKSM